MEKKLTVIPPSQTNGNAKSANSSQCRVAAYCRVSTEQEEQLGSFANQDLHITRIILMKKRNTGLAGIYFPMRGFPVLVREKGQAFAA